MASQQARSVDDNRGTACQFVKKDVKKTSKHVDFIPINEYNIYCYIICFLINKERRIYGIFDNC